MDFTMYVLVVLVGAVIVGLVYDKSGPKEPYIPKPVSDELIKKALNGRRFDDPPRRHNFTPTTAEELPSAFGGPMVHDTYASYTRETGDREPTL